MLTMICYGMDMNWIVMITLYRSIELTVSSIVTIFIFFMSRKSNNIKNSIVLSKWIQELFQKYEH